MATLIGTEPEEVVVTGTTTTNQHALVATFYQPQGTRTKVLADELTFPTDIYALQSQIRLHGLDPTQQLLLAKSRDGRTLDEEDLIAANSRGVPIGFDLSHSVGCVPHSLHSWALISPSVRTTITSTAVPAL